MREVGMCEPHHPQAQRGSLVVAPSVLVEIIYTGMPPSTVGFEHEPPCRDHRVDPLVVRCPRRRRLPDHFRTSRYEIERRAQQPLELAGWRHEAVGETVVDEGAEQRDPRSPRMVVPQASFLELID